MRSARVDRRGLGLGGDRNHGGADMAQVRSWAYLSPQHRDQMRRRLPIGPRCSTRSPAAPPPTDRSAATVGPLPLLVRQAQAAALVRPILPLLAHATRSQIGIAPAFASV